MNSFSGHIADIRTSDALSVVTVNINASVSFKAIVIDSPETASYLTKDHPVNVLFKETEVVIGTGEALAVSLQNKLKGTISALEKGPLLTRVAIHTSAGEIVSVISTASADELDLKESTNVTAMIKLNEIILAP
ncbi:TOBE domain-containing protein [Sinomicrobium weinanense]|uniref:TOBE domain-containing protein n=1 Tax=Sinomicrobium weinanense TaxID=2842200 RepID=A0A926JTG6_9FLAO|nr:TOBE domain-containing protein [Sinomicrobium weinanense]MBC9796896.1 TOBE domain-containing protein [Sinomicrobium weinanense]MBU3124204.1 TOBE domain-containing protein [Sinomicrobium weinanense]